ncbi:hypothetical protein PSEUDO9AG_40020 [Pseudomonas sp. 9Ag]|nr:hypothetical protein PSEUDO9AG_40020 [Pseudomonas sp. 9Ag]
MPSGPADFFGDCALEAATTNWSELAYDNSPTPAPLQRCQLRLGSVRLRNDSQCWEDYFMY